jgi:hypothetical protein
MARMLCGRKTVIMPEAVGIGVLGGGGGSAWLLVDV